MKKMKKMAAMAAALLIAGSALTGGIMPVSAASDDGFGLTLGEEELVTSGTCGENAVWEFDELSATLTISGEGAVTSVDCDMSLEKKVKRLVVEEGITTLPENSVGLMVNVEAVELPASLETLDPSIFLTFVRCGWYIVSPESKTFSSDGGILYSKDKTELVKYPSGLPNEEFTVPDGVEKIGEQAFMVCKSLTSVTIPDSVKRIEMNFYNCPLLTDVRLPEELDFINSDVFMATPYLTARLEKESLLTVGGTLFNGIKAEGHVVLPDTVTKISPLAFGRGVLTSVEFSDTMTEVDEFAFADCDLEHIIFSDSIDSIGIGAFCSTNIRNVVIPATVHTIGGDAFADCRDLESITILDPECDIFDSASTITNKFYTTVSSPNVGANTIITPLNAPSGSARSNEVIEYNGVIRGYKGSTAQAYAEKYGYTFEEIEVPSAVAGDADGDGRITVADVVLVQRYILGKGGLDAPEAADICPDGVINAFDLCLLRKTLVENGSVKPILTMDELIGLVDQHKSWLSGEHLEGYRSRRDPSNSYLRVFDVIDGGSMLTLEISTETRTEICLVTSDGEKIDVRYSEFQKYIADRK